MFATVLFPSDCSQDATESISKALQLVRTHSSRLVLVSVVDPGSPAATEAAAVQLLETVQQAPDLATMGKVIGGGLPVGTYGGRADVMAMVAPEGPMDQVGPADDHLETIARRLVAGIPEAGQSLRAEPARAARHNGQILPWKGTCI